MSATRRYQFFSLALIISMSERLVRKSCAYQSGVDSDQVEQITRLILVYFDGHEDRAVAWLNKNFKVTEPAKLQTAARGGNVIAVLKRMHARKGATT